METNIIKELINKTIVKITRAKKGSDVIYIELSNGEKYKFYHDQSCSGSVDIEDVCGDVNDLIGKPLLQAEETISCNANPKGIEVPEYQDSFTWTFYKFATIKGSVTIRWYGASNGYYSESVDLAVYIDGLGYTNVSYL